MSHREATFASRVFKPHSSSKKRALPLPSLTTSAYDFFSVSVSLSLSPYLSFHSLILWLKCYVNLEHVLSDAMVLSPSGHAAPCTYTGKRISTIWIHSGVLPCFLSSLLLKQMIWHLPCKIFVLEHNLFIHQKFW